MGSGLEIENRGLSEDGEEQQGRLAMDGQPRRRVSISGGGERREREGVWVC